ncbi:MAG TPA: membrane protein insertase YidC [Acidimicrobiales bacterium]|nr:membrane protein insertase YidC [Acidimicrobiales bacterium]
MSAVPVLGSTIGQIFQPLFQAMAWLIAFFYALIPNYAIAIALLTVVVMIVTAPLTVKSTKSMTAMQRLAPELKKLQQKYKGDKQTLNEEMMKLYKEHGVNPAGGCLPMLIQFPIFIILYDVIRGLTNTIKSSTATAKHYFFLPNGTAKLCVHGPCASPRYIGHSTKLYASLLHNNGKMPAFGIDLASKVLGHHSVAQALPYAFLILIAIGLQYFQMRQLNSRNPQMAQANPQAQMMQRYMPILFAVIYINIAAGVNIYFIVSSLCRIGIQEAVFRSGVLSKPAGGATEEVLPGRSGTPAPARRRSLMERLADAQKRALEQQAQQQARRQTMELEAGSPGDGKGSATSKGPAASAAPKKSGPAASPRARDPRGRSPGASVQRREGAASAGPAAPQNGADGRASGNGAPAKGPGPGQSRSKAKRDRRTR